MASNITAPLDDIPSWIPEGYLTVNGPNNQRYVVPDFFVAALQQNLDAEQEKSIFDFGKAAGTSLNFNSPTFGVIGEGKIMAPTSPGSSDAERLSAHAEVLALQERLGISYKDASHRLYMAEMERMKADEKAYKGFVKLQTTTKKALEKAYNSVMKFDREDHNEKGST